MPNPLNLITKIEEGKGLTVLVNGEFVVGEISVPDLEHLKTVADLLAEHYYSLLSASHPSEYDLLHDDTFEGHPVKILTNVSYGHATQWLSENIKSKVVLSEYRIVKS